MTIQLRYRVVTELCQVAKRYFDSNESPDFYIGLCIVFSGKKRCDDPVILRCFIQIGLAIVIVGWLFNRSAVKKGAERLTDLD